MDGSQQDVALALAAYGGGSMLTALALTRILRSLSERTTMLAGAAVLCGVLLAFGLAVPVLPPEAIWPFLLAGWLVMGAGYSLCVTPGGRLLRKSSNEADRPALFAAQFALSHVCWLLAYPVAGQAGALLDMPMASVLLAIIAAIGLGFGLLKWPAADPGAVAHVHTDLPAGHPHLAEHGGGTHQHPYVIDDLHMQWPHRN